MKFLPQKFCLSEKGAFLETVQKIVWTGPGLVSVSTLHTYKFLYLTTGCVVQGIATDC